MNFESQFLKGLYFVSHVLTLISLLAAFILSLNKNKNLTAFKVSLFFQTVFRIGLTTVWILVLWLTWNSIRSAILGHDVYWNDKNVVPYIVFYILSVLIALILAWGVTLIIWTGSSNATIDFINVIFPFAHLNTNFPLVLEIIKAVYGSSEHEIDITSILRQMIVDNQLTVKADNTLAGDPHVGVVKKITIHYKYGNKQYTDTIEEGLIGAIPKMEKKKKWSIL